MIENHYGFPCDIEWAKDKNKFYIVQSRPITTLNTDVKNKGADSINEIKKYKFSKEIDYPFTPNIYFESCHKCYVNNPLIKKLNIKDSPMFVSSQIKKYESWETENTIKINKIETINYIIQESFDIIDKYKLKVDKLSKISYKEVQNPEIIELLKLIDKILIETYHRYVFYTGEHFDTTNQKLLKELPEIRIKLSEFVDQVQQLCTNILTELKLRFKEINAKAFDSATFDEIYALLNNLTSKDEFEKIINRPIAYFGFKNNLKVIKGDEVFDIVSYLLKEDENKSTPNTVVN
jgi:hypothetical protein